MRVTTSLSLLEVPILPNNPGKGENKRELNAGHVNLKRVEREGRLARTVRTSLIVEIGRKGRKEEEKGDVEETIDSDD